MERYHKRAELASKAPQAAESRPREQHPSATTSQHEPRPGPWVRGAAEAMVLVCLDSSARNSHLHGRTLSADCHSRPSRVRHAAEGVAVQAERRSSGLPRIERRADPHCLHGGGRLVVDVPKVRALSAQAGRVDDPGQRSFKDHYERLAGRGRPIPLTSTSPQDPPAGGAQRLPCHPQCQMRLIGGVDESCRPHVPYATPNPHLVCSWHQLPRRVFPSRGRDSSLAGVGRYPDRPH